MHLCQHQKSLLMKFLLADDSFSISSNVWLVEVHLHITEITSYITSHENINNPTEEWVHKIPSIMVYVINDLP